MKKQLFFDDSRLFGRENVVRKYGKPQLSAIYNDGICSTDFCTGYVFRLDDGKYRMLYFGHSKEFYGKKIFCAQSSDGINFTPEKLCLPGKKYDHEIMDMKSGTEVGTIVENKNGKADERYVMLMADANHDLYVMDTIFTSPDLINWKLKDGALWAQGAEPLVSVFYNDIKKCYTIIERPFWGVRLVGYRETTDFETFGEYNFCLRADSIDEPLSEIYGMKSFSYDGMFIGIPHIYRGLKSELNAKYKNGIIDTQLAYSFDGRYWQRSIREPFISGMRTDNEKEKRPLVWISDVSRIDDGRIVFYGSSSRLEHGPAFRNPGTGEMMVYTLREDGFIGLAAEDERKTAVVSTREKAWHGGELCININTNHATLAVYDACESEDVEGMNVLGMTKPLDGFRHEDCVHFSGDSTKWIPQFKDGKKLSDLAGKVLVFEIRFDGGTLYSLSGDYTDLFNTESARYRKFGVLPQ
ncbi:MAG: hypothetical protein E7656_04305 [Ruminococcaceae bacterium]|nr:hypothetical protein [Oscillospiraceae bacterium]